MVFFARRKADVYTPSMQRKLWSLVLVLGLALHAAWSVGGWSVAFAQGDHDHDRLHALGVPHQHDHPGASHQSEYTPQAVAHLAADAGMFSPALIVLPLPLPAATTHGLPRPKVAVRIPRPYLDGLERPPRLSA